MANPFPDTTQSGITSDASKGAFKTGNDLGHLPDQGSSVEGVGSLEKHAQQYAVRHSTKGLGSPRVPGAKVKPMTNIGRAIGRKRF
jgi:hypothetical protein